MILDTNKIVNFTMSDYALDWALKNLTHFAGALLVLAIGVFLARTLSRTAEKALTSSDRLDPTVSKFLSNVVRYVLWAIVLVTVLTQFGVQTTTIIAALGGLALAVGLALQGTLSNVAAGVMILLQRPFHVGESITAGNVEGTIMGIGLFTTEVIQFDGRYMMVPNNELWNKPILNWSRMPRRRMDVVLGISYSDNMEQARRELLDIANADERVLDDPEPVVFVASLGDSSVNMCLRVWCETAEFIKLNWHLTEAAKARFDEVGITIPFPQRDINVNAPLPLEVSAPSPRAGSNGGSAE
ncbi:MAG: mechanosensitive ion channel family protein [Erythrobacter sp.]